MTGAALGWLLPPTGVTTMAGMWRTPTGDTLHQGMPLAVRAAIYAAAVALLVVGTLVAISRVA